MNPRYTRAARWGAVIAIVVGSALAPAVAWADEAPPEPAGLTTPPDGWYLSPAHAWADPTHPNDAGRLYFAPVEIHFTVPTSHWVAHATAPRMSDGVTHCQLQKPDYGLAFQCEAMGTAIPGDYQQTISVRSEDGDNYSFVVDLTVCPLTGCSALFSLALDSAGWSVCPGDELSELGDVAFDYNVPWNASAIAFSPIAGAAGDWVVRGGGMADGDTFSIDGTIPSPGDFSLDVFITDEFGAEHEASLPIHVKSVAECAPPALAATGRDSGATASAAAVLLALGTLLVLARLRAARQKG